MRIEYLLIGIILCGCTNKNSFNDKNKGYKLSNEDTVSRDVFRSKLSPQILALNNEHLNLKAGMLIATLKDTINSILKKKIKNKDLFFETDTSYSIDETEVQVLPEYGWYIYDVEGIYLPSRVEFRICGGFKNVDTLCYSYYSSVVDIYLELTGCEVSKENILIYGYSAVDNQIYDTTQLEVLSAFHPEYDRITE